MPKVKVILDFDGTLTDEVKQADELSKVAMKMLAEEILKVPLERVESHYYETRRKILNKPHKYCWDVNGTNATYAYEGAYLLNTCVLQHLLKSDLKFKRKVKKKFPATGLDSFTRCSNHLFHKGTFEIKPHFLDGVREFLLWMVGHEKLEPVILTNSETRKIAKYLAMIEIGESGTNHEFESEIGILGDTRQYHMDSEWGHNFEHEEYGLIQELAINEKYKVDLRRPIYHEALKREIDNGYDDIVVVADGFSLAGALPLVMGLKFILKKTPHTPDWAEEYVLNHKNGDVVEDISELQEVLAALSRHQETLHERAFAV